ncbi:MAG: GNAT family N-acetyltransferase [Alphaproteobacteria bacterium]|nr:GNAT family N-acetyltransferase [Alphaproteobacteria bacterium]MCW5740625.1 GNAT family N-acetyltransferase [Alphaproteobacteria bacterium]
MIAIDDATPADIPALCDLLGLLFAQEADFTPDRARQERGLRLILDDARVGAILVARDGGQVVGMVNLLFTVSTALGARVLLLEDMIVRPDHRGRGVGLKLIEAAIARATREGCARITLLTDEDNTQAQWFYARAGFRRSAMIPMRRAVP